MIRLYCIEPKDIVKLKRDKKGKTLGVAKGLNQKRNCTNISTQYYNVAYHARTTPMTATEQTGCALAFKAFRETEGRRTMTALTNDSSGDTHSHGDSQ